MTVFEIIAALLTLAAVFSFLNFKLLNLPPAIGLIPYFPDDLRLSAWHVRRNPGIPSVSASFLPK
ncbi:MAG: hypothetical protein FJ304_27775 [Planctomycetes bacterium]|nr:hypothetical protein [Planctomycetota bacterium]